MPGDVLVDAGGEPLEPAAEVAARVLTQRPPRQRPVVQPPHRQVAVELGGTEVARRLAARLQVAPPDLGGVVLGHRVPEREAGGLHVLGQDVRHAIRVAPDLGALGRRARTVERRRRHEQQHAGDEGRGRVPHQCGSGGSGGTPLSGTAVRAVLSIMASIV